MYSGTSAIHNRGAGLLYLEQHVPPDCHTGRAESNIDSDLVGEGDPPTTVSDLDYRANLVSRGGSSTELANCLIHHP